MNNATNITTNNDTQQPDAPPANVSLQTPMVQPATVFYFQRAGEYLASFAGLAAADPGFDAVQAGLAMEAALAEEFPETSGANPAAAREIDAFSLLQTEMVAALRGEPRPSARVADPALSAHLAVTGEAMGRFLVLYEQTARRYQAAGAESEG